MIDVSICDPHDTVLHTQLAAGLDPDLATRGPERAWGARERSHGDAMEDVMESKALDIAMSTSASLSCPAHSARQHTPARMNSQDHRIPPIAHDDTCPTLYALKHAVKQDIFYLSRPLSTHRTPAQCSSSHSAPTARYH